MTRVRDTKAMIAGMEPQLQAGTFVFATVKSAPADCVATVQEAEGLSAIIPTETAKALGLETDLPMAMITLQVHSALDGIGLTAAVAAALADEAISCNVVAGHHHDHIFVPAADANRAVSCLQALAAA
ncbi:MAG: ACT domain-containing protein [Pseudomonadota bacterium]